MASRPLTALKQRYLQTAEQDQTEYPPASRSHAYTRERVLARLSAFSFKAEALAQMSAGIQAEVKIGEHLGMWSQQGRSDEVTLALVDALRQAVVGNATPKPLPTPVIDARVSDVPPSQPT